LRTWMKELKKNKQEDLIKNINLQISDNHHYDDILKIVETPLPATVKSSQCGKLPRFNRTDPNRPSLDDIKFFYNLEYYNFSFFSDLLHTLENDQDVMSYTPPEVSPSPSPVVDIFVESSVDDVHVPHKYDPVGIPSPSHSSHSHSHSDSSSDNPTCPDIPMTHSGSGKGHSISFPCQGKNVVSLSQEGSKDNYIRITDFYLRNHCVVLLGK
jgi:hypothetical protein